MERCSQYTAKQTGYQKSIENIVNIFIKNVSVRVCVCVCVDTPISTYSY